MEETGNGYLQDKWQGVVLLDLQRANPRNKWPKIQEKMLSLVKEMEIKIQER